ncbi:MAG: hypothetical protein ACR2NZ_11880 [Rubripirellula sp.]
MAKEDQGSQSSQPRHSDQFTIALMVSAALAAIGGFAVLFSLWWQTDLNDPHEILRIASREFVAGRTIVAGELAESVKLATPGQTDADSGEDKREPIEADISSPEAIAAEKKHQADLNWICLRDFLVGVGKVARANEQNEPRQRRRNLHDAIPFLQAAKDRGFPPGRQTQGHRILGEALFKLGRFDEAIPELRWTIEQDPSLRRELLPMLAEAQLKSIAGRTVLSNQTILEFLEDRALEPKQRWAGELIRVQTLIALKRWRDVQAAIDQHLQTSIAVERALQAEQIAFFEHLRLLQSVAQIQRARDRLGARPQNDVDNRTKVIAELATALIQLGELQREASPIIAARSRLWAARALLVEGRIDDALTQLAAVRQQRPFGAEAIAGGLEEIELLAQQGRGVELLQTTRYMMRELGDPNGFDASLVGFEEFRRRLADALEQLRRKEQFKYAIDTARSLPPVFDVAEALMQEGIGYREWAVVTIADGTDLSGEVARNASVLARSRYRAAGDAFAEAAKLKFSTKEYISTQWLAIDAYQEGRHFTQSIRLLKPYLRYEDRRQQPRGLVAYGRALLAEDEPETAIDALTTCIVEFPRDPLRYDARLLAALAYAEQGDLENARTLLTDNLEDGELTPQSPAWQNSLLTLGELLYERAYRNYLQAEQAEPAIKLELLRENQPVLEEAVRHLDEAVERYWPIARAESAAYLAARARVMSSRWPRIESQSPEILDAAKRSLRAKADQELQTALDSFARLGKHLSALEEEQRLPVAEQSMLRNCLLAEADILREMERLEDAASAYRAVELRYMNEPPALEAILGRATCAKELGKPNEADMLIRQASVVLQRIPNEWNNRFAETTRYDREGWQDLLGWMNQRINNQGV